jgi:hypothetical protein
VGVVEEIRLLVGGVSWEELLEWEGFVEGCGFFGLRICEI